MKRRDVGIERVEECDSVKRGFKGCHCVRAYMGVMVHVRSCRYLRVKERAWISDDVSKNTDRREGVMEAVEG